MHEIVYAVAATLMGAVVGSFLNVVIYRLPRGEFLSKGRRSVCPACGVEIRWFDNVPVLGWLRLLGRARCCGARISPRYPFVEALTAALFLLLWSYAPHGTPFVGGAWQGERVLPWLLHAYFLSMLVACTFIDIDHRILPDALTKPTMVIGCVGALFVEEFAGTFGSPTLRPVVDSLLFSLVGLGVGYGGTLGILHLARVVFQKDAMGYGDVKFMGAIGAFVGWDGVLLTFFLGCVLGAIGGLLHRLRTGDAYVFFGPFLAAGAVLVLFAKSRIFEAFETFQRWQVESESAPIILAVAAGLSLVLLVVLVKRGRNQ